MPDVEINEMSQSYHNTPNGENPSCPISHNWPQDDFSLEIFSGISKIKRLSPHTGGKGGGLRGIVSNFTRASRKRLLEKMATFRHMDDGYFGTFTYPGDFTYDGKSCKSHLAAFRKRILRLLPKARVIWRMEIKERLSGESIGKPVPHFHLLIFGVPYGHAEYLQTKLGEMWDAIANYHDRDVPFLRSDVTQIRSRKQSVYYASKYAAKIDDGLDADFGRHWGVFGQWDETRSMQIVLTGAEMIQLKRLIRSWLKSHGKPQIARLFAGIRKDFGVAVFGLGDKDDLTGATVTIIDMVICAQRQVQ